MAEPVTPKSQTGFLASTRPEALATPFKGTTCADDAKQTAIRKHLGLHNNNDMFLEDLDAFLAHYLPYSDELKITEEEIDACVSEILSDRNSVLTNTKNGDGSYRLSWTKYHDHEPAAFPTTENVTFQPLGSIIDKIMKHNPRKPKKPLHFRLCPDNWLTSDIDGGNFKIDACFTETYQPKAVSNRRIYLPIELKQERTAYLRMIVHQQILGACHHILNEDPRRMWIFGLTFENDVISVWYFSRSHSVKTFATSWLDDPRTLIKVILLVVNAEHSTLGIDPLVHVGPVSDDDKTLSYVYEIPPQVTGGSPIFYKTGQIRSPVRPMCIAGRVTRVWEVTQVTATDGKIEVHPGKKAILKDVWLDAGAGTETENVEKIFEAVDTFVSTRLEAEIRDELKKSPGTSREAITSDSQTMERLMKQLIDKEKRFQHFDSATKERLRFHLTDKNYRSMFLTKLYDWKGHLSKALSPSAQRCPNLFPRDPDILTDDDYKGTIAPSVQTSSVRSYQGKTQSGLVGSMKRPRYTSLAKLNALSSRGYHPKQQVRVVYEEVCDSLYEVDALGDVVDILCQAIEAAHILYVAGWVHRDLSAGNVLATKTGPNQTWRVKVADFEFARPMIDTERKVRSDPRTGTAFFMPTEILNRGYLYEKSFRKDDSALQPAANPFDDAPEKENANTLAQQFQLSSTHPAYSVFTQLDYIPCLGFNQTLPTDADPSKILPRGSVVNHNFQHDLESIWWILLWFATMNVDCLTSFDWAHKLFNHDIEKFESRIILFNDRLDGKKPTISESLTSELVPTFPQVLESLRSRMVIEYIQRELFGHLDIPESYSQIQGRFSQVFQTLAQMDGSWRDLPIKCGVNPRVMELKDAAKKAAPMPMTAGSKHYRDEDEDEPRAIGSQRNKKTRGQ